jgi:hypothetical protein
LLGPEEFKNFGISEEQCEKRGEKIEWVTDRGANIKKF